MYPESIIVRHCVLVSCLAVMLAPLCEAADSPVDVISKFYKSYLAYDSRGTPDNSRPGIDLSANFAAVVAHTDAVCEKFADYPCGWGADGDAYLDAQEFDPELRYESSGIVIKEAGPGVVTVELNVYPSIKDAGNFYLRSITYQLVNESGRWVVDDVIYSDGKSTRQVLIDEADEA